MKRIMLLAGVVLVFGAAAGYGKENAGTQKAAQSQECKTFDKPLEKRVEEAVLGMESYGEEIQKEIEPIKDSKEKQQRFATRMGEYLSRHVRSNSIKELLTLEAQILENGEGPESMYGWFHAIVHGAVLNLAGYNPTDANPINETVMDIIQNKSVDDYVRSKYVIEIGMKFNRFRNENVEVDNSVKEKVYVYLMNIINDTKSSSILRAESAGVLASIGGESEKITKYLCMLLDEKGDDLVKIRIIYICRLNDEMKKKLLAILRNRSQYLEEVIDIVRDRLQREPSKTYEAIPDLLKILDETTNKEGFKKVTHNLQKYNDSTVMEPIIRKFKELKLEQLRESCNYFNNKLLLEYLPRASKEDRLLITKLIYETVHQISGNMQILHHYDNAISTIKNVLSDENKDMRLLALNTYESMVSAIKHETLASVEKDKERLLKEIIKILMEHKKQEKDKFLLEIIGRALNNIESIRNEKTVTHAD